MGLREIINRPGRRCLWWITAVNVAIFAICGIGMFASRLFGHGYDAASWLGLSSDASRLLTRPWTLMTYMVTHTSGLHLLFNMIWLWLFGMLMDGKRMLWLYIGGGLCGAAAYLASGAPNIPGSMLFGASAAVLAIMVAAAVWFGNERVRFFLIGEVKLKWAVLVCVALAFIGLDGGNAGGGLAHAGGALFGIVYPLIMKRRSTKKAEQKRVMNRSSAKAFKKRVREDLTDMEALDRLLDKIRLSGYDSLSQRERNELEVLSRRMNK